MTLGQSTRTVPADPKWQSWRLFLRFGLTGLLNAGFGYLVFAILLWTGIWPGAALVGAAAAGTAFTFQTSQRLVFRTQGQFARFVLTYAILLLLNWAALRTLHAWGLSDLASQAILTLPVAGLSFICQRRFVFGEMASPRARRNLTEQVAENFKPPLFSPNRSARRRLENALRRFLDLQAGTAWHDLRIELSSAQGSLIDIGCGAQVYRDLIPAAVAYRGIDTADAKARFGYSVPDTHYFEGEDWGVDDGAFDMALCTEVLEHIADPAAFLSRVFRCLRPGGRLVITVPFSARWHFIPFDYWRFTPSSLQMLLTAAGFTQVRVQARGNPLTVVCYKMMTLHLPLLFGANRSLPGCALGILLLPIIGMIACIANLSLRTDWGDDCLGYTVTSLRPIDCAG
jgi:SAM-dependent methyltransferase